MKGGVAMSQSTPKDYFLDGLGCAACAQKIERELAKLAVVKSMSLDFVRCNLRVTLQEDVDEMAFRKKAQEIVAKIESGVRLVARDSTQEVQPGSGIKLRQIAPFVAAVVFFVGAIFAPVGFWTSFVLFTISYLLAGGSVLWRACRNIFRGDFFDENFLMSLATLGAFAIGEFPEGVAVMLFYQVGEFFQDRAVDHSRRSISALLDIRPDYANVLTDDGVVVVAPEEVRRGQIIIVRPGERVPLDGVVIEGTSSLDTSALTGESLPVDVEILARVLSGSVNISGLLKIEVEQEYAQSTVARILDLVENAASRKAPTEQFITKFARYYTPGVVVIALTLAFVPPLFMPGAILSDWVYRALVFLVVSCPCALVISIPLGFFGGLGAASKKGILIKGSNFLEALNNVHTVIFDKTGTLTRGAFEVIDVVPASGVNLVSLVKYAAVAESFSSHPIAESISRRYGGGLDLAGVHSYQEIPGHGVIVEHLEGRILAGNKKLLLREGITFPGVDALGTVVYVSHNGLYIGHLVVADEIRADAVAGIKKLHKRGIKRVVMLTGDARDIAAKIATELGIGEFFAELLPEDKVAKLEAMEKEIVGKGKLVFVGDGINDAPVLARADIGVAMGGLGSAAAVEAADVVIMTDEPSKLAEGIDIASRTRRIVWQNIVFALGVKLVVLALGAAGMATMWEAVFADVGVALLAVLNSTRMLRHS
jgi:Cd2+/Zn2+-exporting ATPase